MPRIWTLLLCVYLLLWVPLNFAVELLGVLPSLATRGPSAAAEVLFHAIVAVTCVTAGWMVWTGAPAALPMAAVAVAASGAAAMQSLFWTVLPRQLAPGERLPLAALTVVHTLFWLIWIRLQAR
jgi:hypothetical protein